MIQQKTIASIYNKQDGLPLMCKMSDLPEETITPLVSFFDHIIKKEIANDQILDILRLAKKDPERSQSGESISRLFYANGGFTPKA
jgi:hypothetical protein